MEWDDEALRRRMRRIPNRLDASMTAIMNRYAVLGESWMKTNATWTDQTGNARQGLHATTDREKLKRYMIILAHAVSYGIWLEVRHNGRYEIINPAMRHVGDQVMQSTAGMFGRLFG